MTDYTGKRRIVAALMRRYTDRVPVTVLIGPYCSQFANYSIFLTTVGNTDGSLFQP